MKLITWGTRGSLPVAGREHIRYGGSTTCLQVLSEYMPEDLLLCIDAGTGFLPMSRAAYAAGGIHQICILQTHWHHDHTQGLLIARPVFDPDVDIDIYGPVDSGIGPKEAYETIMQPPFHPVHVREVRHTMSFHPIEFPSVEIFAVHPVGGVCLMDISRYRRIMRDQKPALPFEDGRAYPADECMTITMHRTDHPERTIGYRFAEPKGPVAVVLTDEEQRAGLPMSLQEFVRGADLLIGDAQYGNDEYAGGKAGFGHGTPDYVVSVGEQCGVPRVGLTHHDPTSDDDLIDDRLRQVRASLSEKGVVREVFACYDGMVIDCSEVPAEPVATA